MLQKNILLEKKDIQILKELAQKKGCSQNAILRMMIREAAL
jgi:hypothetical protein